MVGMTSNVLPLHLVYERENAVRKSKDCRKNVVVYSVFVKMLMANGSVLIVSRPSRRGHFKFDQAFTHGGPSTAVNASDCASPAGILWFGSTLSDGVYWNYLVQLWPSSLKLSDYRATLDDWHDPDQNIYGIGEWWNKIGRPQVFAKMTDAEFLEYQLSH